MMEDHTARTVAHHFRGGPEGHLFVLCDSGMIDDAPGLLFEIVEEERGVPADSPAKRLLAELARYVVEYSPRGPVPGWKELWDYECDRVLQGFGS